MIRKRYRFFSWAYGICCISVLWKYKYFKNSTLNQKNQNNWLSLGNFTFGKGLSFFHYICQSVPWLELLLLLSTFVLNADALSANGSRLFSSLFYLFLELSALFAILLLDGIAPNLTDLLKIFAIMIATGNVSYFLKFNYKNDVGLYFLTTFWEGSLYFLSFIPSVVWEFPFLFPHFPLPWFVFFCLYWKKTAK